MVGVGLFDGYTQNPLVAILCRKAPRFHRMGVSISMNPFSSRNLRVQMEILLGDFIERKYWEESNHRQLLK